MDIETSRTGYTLKVLKCFDEDDDDSEWVSDVRNVKWCGDHFKDGDGNEDFNGNDKDGDVIKKQQPGRCSFKEVLCIHSTWLIL